MAHTNYLSEKDERWKDVVIPYKNSVEKTKPQKRTIVKILEEIENPYRGLDWYKYAKSWNHLTNIFFTPSTSFNADSILCSHISHWIVGTFISVCT